MPLATEGEKKGILDCHQLNCFNDNIEEWKSDEHIQHAEIRQVNM